MEFAYFSCGDLDSKIDTTHISIHVSLVLLLKTENGKNSYRVHSGK